MGRRWRGPRTVATADVPAYEPAESPAQRRVQGLLHRIRPAILPAPGPACPRCAHTIPCGSSEVVASFPVPSTLSPASLTRVWRRLAQASRAGRTAPCSSCQRGCLCAGPPSLRRRTCVVGSDPLPGAAPPTTHWIPRPCASACGAALLRTARRSALSVIPNRRRRYPSASASAPGIRRTRLGTPLRSDARPCWPQTARRYAPIPCAPPLCCS